MKNPALLTLVLIATGACSSSSSSTTPPSQAELLAFTHVTSILTVEVDVEGTSGVLGVDTGDPFLLLNPSTFTSTPTVGDVSTVDVGKHHLKGVPVITSTLSPVGPDPAVPLGGLLGCTVLCQTVASWNYRDAIFTLGKAAPPGRLLPETQVPFSLEGGGRVQLAGTPVNEPKSRVVVRVVIEGVAHTMIVDTGASDVVVDQAVFAALTQDGRAQFGGDSVTTTSGMSKASLTRVKTISVGAASAEGVVVAHDPSFDTNLAAVSSDAGQTIEGSLGGTFLQNFYVTIDYPGRRLHFAPYADRSFIVNPAELIGVAFGPGASDGYPVAVVFPGTDAATKGAAVGDVVVAIDGQTLAPLSASEARVLVGGKVGETRKVQFGSASKLANQTVELKVAQLLPLP